MSNAPKSVIDVWVEGEQARIDRTYNPPLEGQMSPLEIRFHFDQSWDDRTCRVVTLINSDRIYTKEISDDCIIVPCFMVKEGKLKFIVRGYKTTKRMQVVKRDGHFIITDSPLETDEPAYVGVKSISDFVIGDNKTYRDAFARVNTDDKVVITDEELYKETHDVKPVSEDELGYMEANNMDDPIYIGGSNGYARR